MFAIHTPKTYPKIRFNNHIEIIEELKEPVNKDVVAITISVNYTDYLACIIHQNSKMLKEWYIVTSKDDENTIKLIQDSGCENIRTIFYDFKNNNRVFDKGGGIRLAQELIYNKYKDNSELCILILDSDVYLPSNFSEILSKIKIKNNTIYGTRRYDYSTKSDFDKNINGVLHPNPGVIGFFQLYKINSQLYYQYSNDCGGCDDWFTNLFLYKIIIHNLFIKHVGICNTNWYGRKTNKFF